jgi:hypothetical protein
MSTAGVSKMHIPANDKQQLGIVQSFIVFQIFVFMPKSLSIEIAISDTSKTKRRLMFSAASKDIVINPLHSRIPLLNVPVGVWVNLSIDVLSFVAECFKSQTFRSIDFISLSASCKVRRIFSMRNSLMEYERNTTDEFPMEYADVLPKTLSLPSGLPQENINFNIDKLKMIIESELKVSKDSIVNITGKDTGIHHYENQNQIASPILKVGQSNQTNSNNKSNLNLKKGPYGSNNHLTPNNNKLPGKEMNLIQGGNSNNRSRSLARLQKNNNGELLNKQEFILDNFSNKNESKSPHKNEENSSNLNNYKSNLALIGSKINSLNINNKGKLNSGKSNGVSKPNLFLNKSKAGNSSNGNSGKLKQDSLGHNFISPTSNNGVKIKLQNKIDNGKTTATQDNFNTESKSNLLLNTLNYRNMEKWDHSGSVKDNGGDSIEEIYEIDERKSIEKERDKMGFKIEYNTKENK